MIELQTMGDVLRIRVSQRNVENTKCYDHHDKNTEPTFSKTRCDEDDVNVVTALSMSDCEKVPSPIPEPVKWKPVKRAALTGRAQEKWDELDKKQNGWLDAASCLGLAEWVWKSFRPGQEIIGDELRKEGAKLMHRCDINKDGRVDEEVKDIIRFGFHFNGGVISVFYC